MNEIIVCRIGEMTWENQSTQIKNARAYTHAHTEAWD